MLARLGVDLQKTRVRKRFNYKIIETMYEKIYNLFGGGTVEPGAKDQYKFRTFVLYIYRGVVLIITAPRFYSNLVERQSRNTD